MLDVGMYSGAFKMVFRESFEPLSHFCLIFSRSFGWKKTTFVLHSVNAALESKEMHGFGKVFLNSKMFHAEFNNWSHWKQQLNNYELLLFSGSLHVHNICNVWMLTETVFLSFVLFCFVFFRLFFESLLCSCVLRFGFKKFFLFFNY